MKRLVGSLAFVTILASTSTAFAEPQTTDGKVKTYDAATHELNLRGKKNADTVYYVPADLTDPGLKPGARVTITWDLQDDKRMISAVVLKTPKAKPAKATQ